MDLLAHLTTTFPALLHFFACAGATKAKTHAASFNGQELENEETKPTNTGRPRGRQYNERFIFCCCCGSELWRWLQPVAGGESMESNEVGGPPRHMPHERAADREARALAQLSDGVHAQVRKGCGRQSPHLAMAAGEEPAQRRERERERCC
ncbi:hypothetical protein L7F22_029932 [Adiantum nelumboides]|nr:hypothetical protein [Adiantum nelumboides]